LAAHGSGILMRANGWLADFGFRGSLAGNKDVDCTFRRPRFASGRKLRWLAQALLRSKLAGPVPARLRLTSRRFKTREKYLGIRSTEGHPNPLDEFDIFGIILRQGNSV
jgi:hypothetical protein